MERNKIKSMLPTLLNNHKGRNRCITRREIRRLLELDIREDRKLRLVIGELRHEGLPILFETEKPAGYYLPESLAELKAGMDKIRSYIKDECMVLRDIKVLGSRYVIGEKQGVLL